MTRLKLGVHSKQRRHHSTAVKNADQMFTISIGSVVDGGYVHVYGGWGSQSFPLTSPH